jgi:hypothetical protein
MMNLGTITTGEAMDALKLASRDLLLGNRGCIIQKEMMQVLHGFLRHFFGGIQAIF